MEHEDNAQFENYLQNSQSRLESSHLASGDGDSTNVGAGTDAGPKFDGEHNDEEEWKYIKEVQQSEKQQQQIFDDAQFGDGISAKIEGNGIDAELYNADKMGVNEFILLSQQKAAQGNVICMNSGNSSAVDVEDVEVIKNDYDFSTNSNTTTASTGELLPPAVSDVLQVVNKEHTGEQQHYPQEQQQQQHHDEEEPSSVATTYGTSSLSENQIPFEHEAELEPQPAIVEQTQNAIFEQYDNKENADPSDIENQPHNLPAEMHFQLNPNALEFVPSSGSQPSLPLIDGHGSFGTPRPNALAHLLVADDDDLVAESPLKGRGLNMDTITLPGEVEFENEADQRPHSLEDQDEDLFGLNAATAQQAQTNAESSNSLQSNGNNNEDCLDYQHQSPDIFIDHGPETSVDLVGGDIDVMNKSMYLEQTVGTDSAAEAGTVAAGVAPIEDILNSVQMLPVESDSYNNSFSEQSDAHDVESSENVYTIAKKELLHVEEKEHVSHSPSTEELQMNLRNEFHSSTKDIHQLPNDLDSMSVNMQESYYMEHTSHDAKKEQQLLYNNYLAEQSLLTNTELSQTVATNATDVGEVYNTINNTELVTKPNELEFTVDATAAATAAVGAFADAAAAAIAGNITPSPLSSTEEKHLIEDTKEEPLQQAQSAEPVYGQAQSLLEPEPEMQELVHKMNGLLSQDSIVGAPSQAKQADLFAATSEETSNPFALQQGQQLFQEAFDDASASHLIQAQHEQIYDNNATSAASTVAQEERAQWPLSMINDEVSAKLQEFVVASEIENENEKLFSAEIEAPNTVKDINSFAESAQAAEELLVPEGEQIAATSEPVAITPEPAVVAAAQENIAVTPEPVIVATQEPVVAVEETVVGVKDPIVAVEQPAAAVEEPVATEATADASSFTEDAALAALAVAAVAIATTTQTKTAETAKKTTTKSSTAAKPKVGSASPSAVAKKITNTEVVGKKTSTASMTSKPVAATKPRTVPFKSATTTAVTAKSITTASTTTTKPTTATARKTVPTSSTATKLTVTKTRPATAPAATVKPAGTSKTNTTTTTNPRQTAGGGVANVRKTTITTTAATNGTVAKPRAAGSVPTPSKPNTLNANNTTTAAKSKLTSPRAPLSTQTRKTPPGTVATGTRSPTKPVGNGLCSKVSSTTVTTSRTKPSANTSASTTTTTITKTFTARPAPKTTHTSSTITRRFTTHSATTNAGGNTTVASSITLRKSSPLKTVSTTIGNKSSPLKAAATPLKTKAKEPAKAANVSKVRNSIGGGANAATTAIKASSNGQATKEEQQQQEQPAAMALNGNIEAAEEALPVAENYQTGQPITASTAEATLINI